MKYIPARTSHGKALIVTSKDLLNRIWPMDTLVSKIRSSGNGNKVDPKAEKFASLFVESITEQARQQTIVEIFHDGSIELEWNRGPRKIVNVTIDGNGVFRYASLFHFDGMHGRGMVEDGIPADLLQRIDEVTRR